MFCFKDADDKQFLLSEHTSSFSFGSTDLAYHVVLKKCSTVAMVDQKKVILFHNQVDINYLQRYVNSP